MMSEQIAKRIPYGSADYGRMRRGNSYYVDKTHFIPLLSETDVRNILEHYHQTGALQVEIDLCLEVMQLWYDGYCFAKKISADSNSTRLYNSNLVWHFVKPAIREKGIPDALIDQNMRIDYGKLRHLLTVDQQMHQRQLNGNFSQLRSMIHCLTVLLITWPVQLSPSQSPGGLDAPNHNTGRVCWQDRHSLV